MSARGGMIVKSNETQTQPLTVTDGPFAESKEVLCGHSRDLVPTKQDAIDWSAVISSAPCRVR